MAHYHVNAYVQSCKAMLLRNSSTREVTNIYIIAGKENEPNTSAYLSLYREEAEDLVGQLLLCLAEWEAEKQGTNVAQEAGGFRNPILQES